MTSSCTWRCTDAADAAPPVHLELTQILTCPHCGPGHGLIAFVDRMEERRVVAGRLDCPVCERRHTVRGGTVFLGGERTKTGGARDGGRTATGDRPPEDVPDEAFEGLPGPAAAVAALLGPPEGPEILLLAGGAEPLAPAVADLRPDAAVVTWGGEPSERHPRVHPVVPSFAPSAGLRLPFRAGSLGGAVLTGAGRELVAEVSPALEAGARLVVLAPGEGAPSALSSALRELAADARAWVGVRA